MKTNRPKAIHIWDKQGQYIGNILFAQCVPIMSEEDFVDLILEHFPNLKGKSWRTVFAYNYGT